MSGTVPPIPPPLVTNTGGRGKKKDTISSKEEMFAKAVESLSETAPEIISDSESKCDIQEPLPHLPKLLGAEPNDTSKDDITLADLTFTPTVSDEIKKKAYSYTDKLLLTFMEEVKGLKEQIKIPSDASPPVSQSKSSKSTKGKQKTWFDLDEELVSSKYEGVTKVKAFMTVAKEEPYVGKNDVRSGLWVEITHEKGGRGKKKDTISSKEELFAKAVESLSKTAPEIISDSESECDIQEPLPHLPKLLGAEPNDTSKDDISLADLTFTPTVSDEIKKGSTCRSTAHLTKEHPKQAVVMENLAKLKAQLSQGSLFRKAPMILKPFINYKYCSFNDPHSDEYGYYPGCDICGSIAHETVDCTKKPISNKRKPRISSQRSNEPTKKTHGAIFNQNNEVVLIAPRRRDVYVIDMSSYNEESSACFFAKASNSVNWLWHKRLSHLNLKNINKLVRKNLAAGLSSLNFQKIKLAQPVRKGSTIELHSKPRDLLPSVLEVVAKGGDGGGRVVDWW
nr:retrovirus-related Pol polyprotein from transposon TNT 1-94 [Tanacetum cinerariifolium]